MKTSHWAVISSAIIPVANAALTSVCGHAIDVTALNLMSIASEIFAVTIGSADWISRHKTPATSSPSTPPASQAWNILVDKIVAVNGETKTSVVLSAADYIKLQNYTGSLFVQLPQHNTVLPPNIAFSELYKWIVANDPTQQPLQQQPPAQTVTPATLPNGFDWSKAVSWIGTDEKTGLPTLKQGDRVYIGVQGAEIITVMVRDKNNNVVIAADVDFPQVNFVLARQGQDLRGSCSIEIHAYSKALGWGTFEKAFVAT